MRYKWELTMMVTATLMIGHPAAAVTPDWYQVFTGKSTSNDTGYQVTSDAAGNIYVAGSSTALHAIGNDYRVIKYDRLGNQVWTKRYETGGDSVADSIAVNSASEVAVCGHTLPPQGGYELFTVKYASNGDLLWRHRLAAPGVSSVAIGVGFDSAGNVYSAGLTEIVKYDPAGNELWHHSFIGPTFLPGAFTVDAAGNTTTVSSLYDNTSYYILTSRYDPRGTLVWSQRYNGAYYEVGASVAIDPDGNVFVTGSSTQDESNYYYQTIQYGRTGRLHWVRRYQNPHFPRFNMGFGVVADAEGNAYVTGETGGPKGETLFGTIKYDHNGHQQWLAEYTIPGSYSAFAAGIMIDKLGEIVVAGPSNDQLGVVAYNPSGVQLWDMAVGAPNEALRPYSITTTPSGFAVTGSQYSPTTAYNLNIFTIHVTR